MKILSRAEVENLRATFPKGLRIELVEMNDPHSKLLPGDKGTVNFVDDAGGIHINWDKGSTLAAIWGVDIIKTVEGDK